jgi:DNA-damage-inducible protein D
MNKISIPDGSNQLAIFQGKKIRSIKHKGEWWYSVVDIVEVLADSPRPRKYWNALKTKLIEEGSQLSQNVGQLKMLSTDNKEYLTDVMKVEDVLRLIQSISSPKAEPFKRWLAKIGHERIQEYQNPDLVVKRAMLQYQARGYDDEWIKIRVNNIVGRKDLEGEWSQRGVKQGLEFALLTDAMSMEAFGVKTSEHRDIKQLGQSHSLRDNMTSLELLFTSLAEQSTAKIARKQNAQGFDQNKHAARAGGKIAGDARKNLELELGEPVITKHNYLTQKQRENRDKSISADQKKFDQLLNRSSLPLKTEE